MPSVTEAANGPTDMAAVLQSGLDTLSIQQRITFTRYVRLVLPLDGYAFWVRADLVSPSALVGLGGIGQARYGDPGINPANVLTREGSLHYAINHRQDETETIAINRVIFTAESLVQDLNAISPTEIYIGEFEGIRFAFSQRNKFYKQSGLYHYVGDAIYPAMLPAIIDNPGQIDVTNIVVSNSLPIWLTLTKYMPVYPSFIVPDNVPPPYAICHIAPDFTRALQPVPLYTSTSTRYQLASDRVRITLQGARNNTASDFMDYVLAYMATTDTMGLMGDPIIRDGKRTQTELTTVAMTKTIDFEVSYHQSRVRDLARQYILSCVPSVIVA